MMEWEKKQVKIQMNNAVRFSVEETAESYRNKIAKVLEKFLKEGKLSGSQYDELLDENDNVYSSFVCLEGDKK